MITKLYTLTITRYGTQTTTYFYSPFNRAREKKTLYNERLSTGTILIDLTETEIATLKDIDNYTWDEIEYWYNPKKPKINEIIKDLRKKNKFTQKKIANELNITQQAYSKIEKGLTEISIEQLKKIECIYNQEIYTLI